MRDFQHFVVYSFHVKLRNDIEGPMDKIHIALAVKDLEKSISEYKQRLGCKPVAIAKGRYALWRTDILNLSITQDAENAGMLRHLGFESSEAARMVSDYDTDGFKWEYFTAEQQRLEIIKHYPDGVYKD